MGLRARSNDGNPENWGRIREGRIGHWWGRIQLTPPPQGRTESDSAYSERLISSARNFGVVGYYIDLGVNHLYPTLPHAENYGPPTEIFMGWVSNQEGVWGDQAENDHGGSQYHELGLFGITAGNIIIKRVDTLEVWPAIVNSGEGADNNDWARLRTNSTVRSLIRALSANPWPIAADRNYQGGPFATPVESLDYHVDPPTTTIRPVRVAETTIPERDAVGGLAGGRYPASGSLPYRVRLHLNGNPTIEGGWFIHNTSWIHRQYLVDQIALGLVNLKGKSEGVVQATPPWPNLAPGSPLYVVLGFQAHSGRSGWSGYVPFALQALVHAEAERAEIIRLFGSTGDDDLPKYLRGVPGARDMILKDIIGARQHSYFVAEAVAGIIAGTVTAISMLRYLEKFEAGRQLAVLNNQALTLGSIRRRGDGVYLGPTPSLLEYGGSDGRATGQFMGWPYFGHDQRYQDLSARVTNPFRLGRLDWFGLQLGVKTGTSIETQSNIVRGLIYECVTARQIGDTMPTLQAFVLPVDAMLRQRRAELRFAEQALFDTANSVHDGGVEWMPAT